LISTDEFEQARPRLDRLERLAAERGSENDRSVLLSLRVLLDWRAGRWAQAHEAARSKLELSWRRGLAHPPPGAYLLCALIDAMRGELDSAQKNAELSIDYARRGALPIFEEWSLWVLGFAALSAGRAAEAHARFTASMEMAPRELVPIPIRPVLPDAAEALAQLGELEEAEGMVARFEEASRPLSLAWATARAERCRAIVAAARGELERSLVHSEHALHAHARFPDPFERARTLLVHGGTLRRAQQKRAARECLGEALAELDRLGAAEWVERARSELGRIGGRAAVSSGLSASEERVARLAAAGRTNREIADELFVSVKTVEATLSKAYRKLQVRSRTELGPALSAADQS
jgi:DNA-binding CsgD family transcriptional regulator